MRFEWNDAKRESNVAKHGIDFVDVLRAFEAPMLTTVDQRRAYGEVRRRALGVIDGRVVAWSRGRVSLDRTRRRYPSHFGSEGKCQRTRALPNRTPK